MIPEATGDTFPLSLLMDFGAILFAHVLDPMLEACLFLQFLLTCQSKGGKATSSIAGPIYQTNSSQVLERNTDLLCLILEPLKVGW